MQVSHCRELHDYGLVPLHALCPQLDSVARLQDVHARLMAKSVVAEGEREDGAAGRAGGSSLHPPSPT